MIKSYRSKKTIEALQWVGSNRIELEDFLGKGNVDFIIYSNKDPIPTIKEDEVHLKDFVVKDGENVKVYTESDFVDLFGD